MEEHVGDPDSTHTNGEGGNDDAPSEYLESLRARFDQLASRIEAATQESLERTQSLLTEPDDSASVPPETPGEEPDDSTPVEEPDDSTPVDDTPSADTPEVSEPPDEPREEPGAPPSPGPSPDIDEGEPPAAADAPQPQQASGVDPAAETSVAGDEPIAHDADLDEWDETAPPVAPAESPRSRSRHPDSKPDELTDPQTLAAQLRSRMRPVADPHRRRKIAVRVAVVAVLVVIAFVVGRWWALSNRSSATPVEVGTEQPTPTTTPADPTDGADLPDTAQADAEAALVDGGLTDIAVTVEDGTAVLTGSVASEEAKASAAAAVGSVAGVDAVDNQIVVEPPPPLDPAEVPAAAEQARDDAGFGHLGVTVIDGTATITGVIPRDELGGGYFAYSAPLRRALLAVNGIDMVRTRLQLRGDEATLSRDLDALVETSPIVFASGSADLTSESELALDQAAVIISDNPGIRVIVAGHTDPAGSAASNEVLALARANTVIGYLVGRGIPAVRLVAVTYGELFPELAGGLEASRRIAFEVAP